MHDLIGLYKTATKQYDKPISEQIEEDKEWQRIPLYSLK